MYISDGHFEDGLDIFGYLDMPTWKSSVWWFFWQKMEVLVQLSRSESLKSRATIFEVILRVGVQKKVCAWGLNANF